MDNGQFDPNENNYNQNYQYNPTPEPPKKNKGPKVGLIIAISVLAIAVIGVGVSVVGGMFKFISTYSQSSVNEIADSSDDDPVSDDKAIATTPPVSVVESGTVDMGGVSDISGIVEAVMPSIVSITSTTSVEGYSMFGQLYSQEVPSCGTGFIVGQNDNELLLATNNHVVEDATAIQVTFADESTAEAVIKGTDAQADLAVVAVDLEDISSETMEVIKVAILGDSDAIKVGQMAIAIGNAQGMGQSLTVGYISAKERELDFQDTVTGGTKKMKFLQTDAAINGGNSGGPLLDINGNVVGINSAKISDTQVEGMCFAIPISSAIPIINELMNRETLSDDEKGYIGISLQDISNDAVEMYGVPDGVYIYSVSKKGPAEKAGLQAGDIITEINGVAVNTQSAAADKVNSYRAGTEIELVVYRQNANGTGYEPMDVKVTLVTAEDAGVAEDASTKKEQQDQQQQEQQQQEQQQQQDEYSNSMDDWFSQMFPW